MWASNHIASYSVTGRMAARQGTGHPSLTPYQAFECSDGPLMICPGNDRLWRKFAEALGHPEWPDEARFRTNVERMQQRDLLLGMISDIMKSESRAHWSAKLDALGVPNGPLNTVPQVLELAQVAALGMFAKPYAGHDALFHGLPVSFDGSSRGRTGRWRRRSASTTTGAEPQLAKLRQYSRTRSSGMRAWLWTMMNLPPGIGAVGQLHQALEVVGAPHAGLLREQVHVGGVAGVPVDVIVEQVALQLGDAGVERILGPRHAERHARLRQQQRRRGDPGSRCEDAPASAPPACRAAGWA